MPLVFTNLSQKKCTEGLPATYGGTSGTIQKEWRQVGEGKRRHSMTARIDPLREGGVAPTVGYFFLDRNGEKRIDSQKRFRARIRTL
jgi:hypothetical protein